MTVLAQRIAEFDTWRPGYGGASVIIYKAGTTEPASCWANMQGTVPAANPQTLLSKTLSGLDYGKFPAPVYVNGAYYLVINSSDETGVTRPSITSLGGENAGLALVTPTGGSKARTLADLMAEFVHVRTYGDLGTVPVTNTASIAAAIGAVSTKGGGTVRLPAGTFPVNSFSIPNNVILAGEARGSTTLTCAATGNCITIAGDDAGLSNITIDGISAIAASVGVFARARRRVVMDNVEIKRFATGLHCVGGRDHVYRRLRVLNCHKNVRLLGDLDTANGGLGDEFSGLDWLSGTVGESLEVGLEMTMNNAPVRHNTIAQVDFSYNTVTGVHLQGASWTVLRQCYWFGNAVNLQTADGIDATQDDRDVVSLHVEGGQVINGKCTFNGLCQDFVIESAELSNLEFNMSVPRAPVLLRDCVESNNTITGETTMLTRWRTGDRGVIVGQTGTATGQPVWRYKLGPGDVVHLDIRVAAEQTNGERAIVWHYSAGARCGHATLTYDNVTTAFTVGRTIKGQTSNATAVIAALPSGATALIGDLRGTFQDDEQIKETSGPGQAQMNGALAFGTAALLGTPVLLYHGYTGVYPWSVGIGVAAQELVVSVYGEAATNVSWVVQVNVTGL